MKPSVNVVVEDAAWQEAMPDIDERARAAVRTALGFDGLQLPASIAGAEAPEIAIVFTDDERQRALNRRFREIDRPTNVLSFTAWPEVGGAPAQPVTLGDVVLARQTIAAEARAGGVALGDHVTHLIVHGVLHLLGYDHDQDNDAEVMESLESAILGHLGVADPYDREHRSE